MVREGEAVRIRSIPACAGEPHKGRQMTTQRWVYPRVCGGAWRAHVDEGREPSLSPRVRGSQRLGQGGRLVRGSIPACAGEPGQDLDRWAMDKVYPRVCGGASGWGRAVVSYVGLSPRVRGSRGKTWTGGQWTRSIPACAGEPGRKANEHHRAGVYPRVCGGAIVHQQGSIPACAGEPCGSRRRGSADKVYPRVCGGATNKRNDMDDTKGLSPRVRGSRDRLSRGRGTRGSIPACAGEPGAGEI